MCRIKVALTTTYNNVQYLSLRENVRILYKRSTPSDHLDADAGDGEVDENISDALREGLGFTSEEEAEWDEAGPHLETLQLGHVGPGPLLRTIASLGWTSSKISPKQTLLSDM